MELIKIFGAYPLEGEDQGVIGSTTCPHQGVPEVTVVKIVNVASQIQRCRGPRQKYSVMDVTVENVVNV